MLTTFSPIPTSNQCCCFTAPEPPPSSAPGRREPPGLVPAGGSHIPPHPYPALDFVESLSCFPQLARPKAQHPWGCSAIAFMQYSCTDVHEDQPHHLSKARHRSMGCKDQGGPALSAAGHIPASLGSHHSPGEVQTPEERGPALPRHCSHTPAQASGLPKAAAEDAASDEATVWHGKGWKPAICPHTSFLSTFPVSLVPAGAGSCESQDFT